jgi:hypothetical protein
MRWARTSIAGFWMIASACIHPNPETAIRAAFGDKFPNAQPLVGADGARCSEARVAVKEVMGNEAIATLFQDCSSGTGVTRFSSDYLLVKQGQKWKIVKPLSGAAEMRS